jgi:hypothetical protein
MKLGNFNSKTLRILTIILISSTFCKLTLLGSSPQLTETESNKSFEKNLNQTIWYIEYNEAEDYHKIGHKYIKKSGDFSAATDLSFIGTNYLVKVTSRDSGSIYSEEDVSLGDSNNKKYSKYRYYIPDFNGLHRKKKSFVIWNITPHVVTCHVEYYIKYFDCDTTAETFYDDLDENLSTVNIFDKKKVILRTATESNNEFNNFLNQLEIKRILTNLMECENITVPAPANPQTIKTTREDCCMPYPCLVDAMSINCVCALMPTSPECDCAKNKKCDTRFVPITTVPDIK